MGTWCDRYKAPDVEIQLKHLKSSIRTSAAHLRDSSGSFSSCRFHHLAHCLLFLDDEEAACVAFERQITKCADGIIKHNVFCNLCGPSTMITGERHVCRSCPNVDLCHSCKKKYDRGASVPGCVRHKFLRIPRDNWRELAADTLDESGLSIDQWLGHLQCKIGDKPKPTATSCLLYTSPSPRDCS